MKTKRFTLFTFCFVILVSLCGCIVTTQEPVDRDLLSTQVAQTVIAEIASQVVPSNTPFEPSFTPTTVPSSPTTEPTDTPTPSPTDTPLPTDTPEPTDTPLPTPTETPIPDPCDWAQFVDDVTIKDGTAFTPDVEFTKTWRLRNIGTCTWTTDYDLVFASGERMGGDSVIPLSKSVSPGNVVDISVDLEAPRSAGEYRGYWLLRNDAGVLFGVGRSTDDPFWVEIDVLRPKREYTYDFAINYCAAEWESGAGDLPCPGNSGDEDGFVVLLSEPNLEHRKEDEPALWVRPNEKDNGWISATYPPLKIIKGDHFSAWVGCLAESEGCDVTFYLDYQIDGGLIRNLDSWEEEFDEEARSVFVDLSDLRGEKVQFILTVEVNNDEPEDANAFWLVPHIDHKSFVE